MRGKPLDTQARRIPTPLSRIGKAQHSLPSRHNEPQTDVMTLYSIRVFSPVWRSACGKLSVHPVCDGCALPLRQSGGGAIYVARPHNEEYRILSRPP